MLSKFSWRPSAQRQVYSSPRPVLPMLTVPLAGSALAHRLGSRGSRLKMMRLPSACTICTVRPDTYRSVSYDSFQPRPTRLVDEPGLLCALL